MGGPPAAGGRTYTNDEGTNREIADRFCPAGEGWLYLAVLIDLFSRRVVGRAMSERNDRYRVLSALTIAVTNRGLQAGSVLHH